MATKDEYTIGTNAALPKALADIQALIPEGFMGEIAKKYVTFATLSPVVADIVVAALDAVDASRAAEKGA